MYREQDQPVGSGYFKYERVAVTSIAPGYMALPFDRVRLGPERCAQILQTFCEHPSWMTLPFEPAVMKLVAAKILTNPENRVMEVWKGGEFVGLLLLTGITPGVDALVHFVFFDRNLVGKRGLILNWLDQCFEEFQLQRVSLEVPETVEVLASFARRKLGFKYEGEDRDPTLKHQDAVHQAKQGSRKEKAHFDKGEWHDILRLRLLREERTK
jgi:RimJ/RimL family protein N-acetyltransferase